MHFSFLNLRSPFCSERFSTLRISITGYIHCSKKNKRTPKTHQISLGKKILLNIYSDVTGTKGCHIVWLNSKTQVMWEASPGSQNVIAAFQNDSPGGSPSSSGPGHRWAPRQSEVQSGDIGYTKT